MSVSISPEVSNLAPSQTQQFVALVQGTGNTAVSWMVDKIPGGNLPTGNISVSGLYTAPASSGTHDVTAVSAADTSKSATAHVAVASVVTRAGVFTQRFDNSRSGQNLNESVLTLANVQSSTFGKIASYPVDGHILSQPLYVSNLSVPEKGTYNVVFVTTEHDSVYAFDADGNASGPLWKRSFINPGAGITTVPTSDVKSTVSPEIGITSTPVIDTTTGTIYVVPFTKENGTYVHRLHALDIATGNEKFGGPVLIQASVPGNGTGNDGNGNVPFQGKVQLQRAALLLLNGVVYLAWSSHGDNWAYHGWITGYDALTLRQVLVWNVTPNGQQGAIWQSGCGLSADAEDNIYVVTANGTFDAASGGSDFGDSIVKLTPTSSGLAVSDYFAPFDQAALAADDADLGAAGLVLIPGTSLGIFADKKGNIYVIDLKNLGHFQTSSNSQIVQFLPKAISNEPSSPNFGTAAYFNGFVYFIGQNDFARQFQLVDGKLTTSPVALSNNRFGHRGASPVVSANGASNAILWATERISSSVNGILHAYDASNVANELYNSNQAGSRDTFGPATKFSTPTVINGKVYVGGENQLAIFALLEQ